MFNFYRKKKSINKNPQSAFAHSYYAYSSTKKKDLTVVNWNTFQTSTAQPTIQDKRHVETLQQLRTTSQTSIETVSQCYFRQIEIGKTVVSSWWSLVSVLISTMLLGVHQLNLVNQLYRLFRWREGGKEWQWWQVHILDVMLVAWVTNASRQVTWNLMIDCRLIPEYFVDFQHS